MAKLPTIYAYVSLFDMLRIYIYVMTIPIDNKNFQTDFYIVFPLIFTYYTILSLRILPYKKSQENTIFVYSMFNQFLF